MWRAAVPGTLLHVFLHVRDVGTPFSFNITQEPITLVIVAETSFVPLRTLCDHSNVTTKADPFNLSQQLCPERRIPQRAWTNPF
jgi:hypothetical protein